jgi:hypothetical protein
LKTPAVETFPQIASTWQAGRAKHKASEREKRVPPEMTILSGIIVHASNSSYLGGRDRISVQGQPRKKFSEISSQQTNQMWWHASMVPATQEAYVGGSQPEAPIWAKI